MYRTILIYTASQAHKRGVAASLLYIHNFPLQVLASTILRVAGSSSLHLATWNQMRLAVDCMQGALYDWCSGVIPIMRKHLSDCERGRRKNFGYSSILVAFFFERVSGLSPIVPLPVGSPRQPRLSRWGDIFLYQGGGGSVQSVYDNKFYFWWER